jgi:hypothetical protein
LTEKEGITEERTRMTERKEGMTEKRETTGVTEKRRND